jgi:hypothetical protein
VSGVAVDVAAWGATGHRLVAVAAMRALPGDLPAFLRAPGVAAEVGELAREPDRWKAAGQPHDRERDTAHFVDMTDDGHVMTAQGMSIDALPRLKSEYDAALQAAGIKVDDAGYLPYALMDGWQQLERDFAYWRVLNAAEAREADPARRAWYREDRERRERLLIRDLGVWAHYVGDASQPLHTSIHYNGWDRDTANPEGFTTSRQTHGMFESEFIRRNVRLDAVEAAMPGPREGDFDLRARTAAYLRETLVETTPFYRLEKAGGFAEGDARGPAFATARIAAGAAELRDLTVQAWRASANASVGWPAVKVAEVEAGSVDPWDSLVGKD